MLALFRPVVAAWRFAYIVILACLYGFASQAAAHGGGLNSEGCHHNRKTGDYHCHRAPVQKAQAALASAPVPASTARPQCFTGPRGGTYTITASGRKNYGGC
jgi:hypothetical protein